MAWNFLDKDTWQRKYRDGQLPLFDRKIARIAIGVPAPERARQPELLPS